MDIVTCPHCRVRVALTATGECPACRRSFHDAPAAAAPDPPAVRSAWDQSQLLLRALDVQWPLGELDKLERPFVARREAAIRSLGTATPNGSEHAQIINDLLPHFAAVISEFRSHFLEQNRERVINSLEARANAWKQLAAALDANDACELAALEVGWAATCRPRDAIASPLNRTGGRSLATGLRTIGAGLLLMSLLVGTNQAAEDSLVASLVFGAAGALLLCFAPQINGILTATEPVVDPRIRALAVAQFHQGLTTFTPHVVAVPVIVGLNVLVYVIMVARGVSPSEPTANALIAWGANFGPLTTNDEWWRLLTHQFLHAGFRHLLFNMLALLSVGPLLERLVGNVGFVILYLVAGICGGIVRLYWDPYLVSVGASGSVYGIATGLLGFVAFRVASIPPLARQQILKNIGGFIACNVFYATMATGIDHAAHIGGAAAGLIGGLIMSQHLPIVSVSSRLYRNAIVAAAGTLVAVTTMIFPPDVVSIEEEIKQVGAIESTTLEESQALSVSLMQEKISQAEFADAIQAKVLPPWTDARKRIERLLQLPYGDQEVLKMLTDSFRLREDSWKLHVQAIQQNSPAIEQQAVDKWEAADDAVKAITARLAEKAD